MMGLGTSLGTIFWGATPSFLELKRGGPYWPRPTLLGHERQARGERHLSNLVGPLDQLVGHPIRKIPTPARIPGRPIGRPFEHYRLVGGPPANPTGPKPPNDTT